MRPTPRVSIVLPTYNGAKYIRQSIDSCLGQSYGNIELVVVDDGSTDATPSIVHSYQDERIRYVRHKDNMGLPHALNTGFAAASGDYLTWTSDDNFYAHDAIEKMLSFLKNRNCAFVYCDFYRFDDHDPSRRRVIKLPDSLSLENENSVGPCFLYSREVLKAVGNYDPDAFLDEDYDYWIRVSKRFSMFHLSEPLYFYREHGESLSMSRFREGTMVGILVRMKNELLDMDRAINLLVALAAQKYPRYLGMNKILVRILHSRRINRVLRSFETGKLTLKGARLALEDIVTDN